MDHLTDCLDRFDNNMKAVADDLLTYATTLVHNVEDWIVARLRVRPEWSVVRLYDSADVLLGLEQLWHELCTSRYGLIVRIRPVRRRAALHRRAHASQAFA